MVIPCYRCIQTHWLSLCLGLIGAPRATGNHVRQRTPARKAPTAHVGWTGKDHSRDIRAAYTVVLGKAADRTPALRGPSEPCPTGTDHNSLELEVVQET